MTPTPTAMAEWLVTYSKGKPIYRYAGDYWGISRNRCTLIPRAVIDTMIQEGSARYVGVSREAFVMTRCPEGNRLFNLGSKQMTKGDYAGAAASLGAAIIKFKEAGDRLGEQSARASYRFALDYAPPQKKGTSL